MIAHENAVHVTAGISVPAWLLSVAVQTLPLVQWMAGLVAIVAGGLSIYAWFERRGK